MTTGAGSKRAIPGGATARTLSYFVGGATTRITGPLMGAEEEDGVIIIECILSAVAVVNIPINYQNASDAVVALQVSGRNGHVVEDTETHTCVGRGVMTGRATKPVTERRTS